MDLSGRPPGRALRAGLARVPQSAGDLSDPVRQAFDRAAAQTLELWTRTGRRDSMSEEARAAVSLLGRAVWQRFGGSESAALEAAASPVPLRRLLATLRRSFLQQATVIPDDCAGRALQLVRAMEEVQYVLDRDQAQRFVEGRAAPDALDLVVEIAHDMRSPLGAILMLVESLRRAWNGSGRPVEERQLGLIHGAAFGLNALVSDVVELARGGDRLVEGAPMAFSVSDILHSLAEIVQPVAEEKGLSLRYTPPDLDWRVGYPGAISRVLLNLTVNALKFTDDGFVEVTARQITHTRIEFAVSDTGLGLDHDTREALFHAFRGGAEGSVRFSSAGLGLQICRKLIAAMHGELTVESPAGGGSRFAFALELPLADRM